MSDRGYACVHRAGGAGTAGGAPLAEEFSPRYEVDGDRSITIDISGLGRLLGSFRAIGIEIMREAARRGLDVHVAVAGTCTAARILARARPGLTVVLPGEEAAALAPLRVAALSANSQFLIPNSKLHVSDVLSRWGIHTLGAFAALPAADIRARLGRQGPVWQALARGEDVRPLVPDQIEERFEATLDLEWPIEGLEPLSFVLTRLLEPLSTRLERRDRAAAALHVVLGLVAGAGGAGHDDPPVSPVEHVRRLQFPTPLCEVRTLRTLALIDMESHPPDGPIERVTVTIEPTPGRVLQHTLFSRAEPTPDEISTLLARLAALLGSGRIGAPTAVDSYRPGAFAMGAFGLQTPDSGLRVGSRLQAAGAESRIPNSPDPQSPDPQSVLRRFRQPVPVRVTVEAGRPIRVAADRRGFGDSRVVSSAGPWRSSGEWWTTGSGRAGKAGGTPAPVKDTSACGPREESESSSAAARASGGGAPRALEWDHEEWDVAMADGAVYRVFRECGAGGWFLDAIVD